MTNDDAICFIEEIKKIVSAEIKKELTSYVKVAQGKVVSVSGTTAVVKLLYSDSSFNATIVTSQTVSANDLVSIAYWANLSTAIILHKG